MFKIVIYTILSIFKNSPSGLGQAAASPGGLSGKVLDVTLFCEIPDLVRLDAELKSLKRFPEISLHSQPFPFVTTRPPQLRVIWRTSLSLKISVLAYDASRPALMTAVECASAPTRPAPDGRGRGLAGAARGRRLPRSVPRPRPSLSEKYARGTLKGSSCRPPHRRSAAGVLT